MRSVVLALVIFAVAPLVHAQTADKDAGAEMIKDIVGRIAASRKTDAEIVLKDLREIEGKIDGVYPDYFLVRNKKKKKPLVSITIGGNPQGSGKKHREVYYRDVLQIEGAGLAMSLVPDPKATPYSTWDEVRSIGTGELVQLLLADGTKRNGVFMTGSTDAVALMRGNTKTEFKRETIVRVYRITGDTRSLSSRILAGGAKGAEVAEDNFPIFDPAARAHPFAIAVAAGVGVLIYLLPRTGVKRVLVFSR